MVQALETFVRQRDFRQRARLLFNIYDTDGDGFVGKNDLLSTLRHLSVEQGVSDAELSKACDAMLDAFDSDGDRRLSLQEFSDLVEQSNQLGSGDSVQKLVGSRG